MNRYCLILSLSLINYCLAANEYYTYDKIDSTLHAWQGTFGTNPHPSNDYPGFGIIYALKTIGYSSQDSLPIYAVKLSANVQEKEPEPKVLILGQCHAEEIYGVEIAMEIINQFLHPELNNENRQYLQNGLYGTELWIVPTHNPEGLNVVHGWERNGEYLEDPTYRKNIKDVIDISNFNYQAGVGNDSDGVDLNRNFDFNWSFGDELLKPCTGDCSSYNDKYDYYRGENPESELETQAIVKLANEQNFLLSIAYHSSRSGRIDRYVIYPWAWKDKCGCDDPSQRQYAPGFNIIEKLGSEIAELTGTDLGENYLQTGSSYRKGNAHDWLYRETGCIQYLVEVGYTPDHDYAGELLIQNSTLGQVINSNLDAFFHLLMRAVGENDPTIDLNQVRGVITDASSNNPLPNACVSIPKLEDNIVKSRLVDSTGFYARLLHPEESYTMVVSAFGYQTTDTLDISHSSSGATIQDIGLIPLPNYGVTFYIQTPDHYDGNLQLIRHHIHQSDTLLITSGETMTWPEGDYQLIINGTGYMTKVIDIKLDDNMELSVNLLYEDIIWEENPSGTWNLAEELSIPLHNITAGDSVIIEMNFRYELEWDYDYFIIDYIDENETTEIMKFTGDHYKYYTEYIPFEIPEGHSNGRLHLHLDADSSIDYRGVEFEYIKVMKGSEISLGIPIDIPNTLPSEFQLQQNYPNPFNPSTNIQFSVSNLSPVSISIFNVRGEFIEYLVNDIYAPGNYTMHMDAGDYSSGIYFYRLQTESSIFTRKFIIIK